jgi:PDZ domain-containing secreted protein
VRELSKENKDLINQLKALNENIDLLTRVTAISVGKETIFKGKKEMGDKVDALDGFDLPDRIIAMLVGSTEGSVASLRSQKKAKEKKIVQSAPEQEEVKQK